ncbi:hypothetical protein BDZ97DRAFT_247232 [Flammula alnicola]|nr:hypothetical protein BDZ97DRAFT_247232 [Flammula alnicola]
MRRRIPLQELPLESFLPPPDPNVPGSVKPIRSNKRPFSPSGPSPFSPAKRRILNEEGIFSCRSPLPSCKESLASPARFSHVLAGPASPARVLDFGMPKNYGGDPQKRPVSYTPALDATPTQTSTSSTTRLAPSPELKSRSARPTGKSKFQHGVDASDITPPTSPPRPSITANFIPRELPAQSEPWSIHYPGFVVFQDTHTIIYPEQEEFISDMEVDDETHKENLPPRRKTRKAATAPSGSGKSAAFSSDGVSPKKSQSTKHTPRKAMVWMTADSSSSRHKSNKADDLLSPSSTPQNGKKTLRQLMKDESDLGEGQNDGYE